MSIMLEDADIAELTVLLSADRLAALITLTGSARTAIELHQKTLSLGACLMNVIASVELSLRNKVCENLTVFFATPGWLTHPPAPFQWRTIENSNAQKALESARRATYSKLNQAGKSALDAKAFPNGIPQNTSHLRRAVGRRRQIPVTDGQVIAETTFYFWKRLFSTEYEQSLWRPTLKRTFPNKHLKRPQVASQLEHIYQARNRLAHHEPVLHKRFADKVTAIEFVSRNMGMVSESPNTALARLIADDLQILKDKAAELHRRLDSFRTL
jgi:hypothetical protein